MAFIEKAYTFYTPAGTVLKNANVSVYFNKTSTAARVFDAGQNLKDTAPQLTTDDTGYVLMYFDDDDFQTGQTFDLVASPDAKCNPTENEVHLIGVGLTTNWSEIRDDDGHMPEDDATYGADYYENLTNVGATGVFRETFEASLATIDANWPSSSGSGETSRASGGETGGYFYRIGNNAGDDMRWMIWNKSIPYDADKLTRLRCRIKQVHGAGTCYLGIAGRNAADDAWVNTAGADLVTSQHFVMASGASPGASFVEYTGYIKGTAATGETGAHADLTDPAKLHEDVRYIRPIIIVNYNAAAGQYGIDEFSIDIIPEKVPEADNTDHANDTDTDSTFAHNIHGTLDLYYPSDGFQMLRLYDKNDVLRGYLTTQSSDVSDPYLMINAANTLWLRGHAYSYFNTTTGAIYIESGTTTPAVLYLKGSYISFNDSTVRIDGSDMYPFTNDSVSCGKSSQKWSDVYTVLQHTGDILFSDTHCPICKKRFKKGDSIILTILDYLKQKDGDEIDCVPMHLHCAK